MRHPRFSLASIFSLCLASNVSATPIEVRFTGSLTRVHDFLDSFVGLGAPRVVDMALNTDAPNGCAHPPEGALGRALIEELRARRP
jgi:hypothetical protein